MPETSNGQMQMHQLIAQLAGQNPENKLQSHGLTQAQMKELNAKKEAGEIETIPGNIDKKFSVKKHEAHLIHISMENVSFHPKTGKKLSKPSVKKFYVKDFESMSNTVPGPGNPNPRNAFEGLEVIILHDPRKDGKQAPKEDPNPVKKAPRGAGSKRTREDLIEEYKSKNDGEAPDESYSDSDIEAMLNEK